MLNRIVVFFFFSFFLIGCDNTKQHQPCKDVFSSWYAPDLGVGLNFTGLDFDKPVTFTAEVDGGASCVMSMNIQGLQCAGTLTIEKSHYFNGGDGDPGCESLNGLKNYTIEGLKMTVCDDNNATDCVVYE